MATEADRTRCHAITERGERCERPAGEDGFCYQHDESDETVEEYDGEIVDGDEDGGPTAGAQDQAAMSDGGTAAEAERKSEGEGGEEGDDQSEGDGGTDGSSDGGSTDEGGLTGVREVRETVQSLAPEVIGRELDAVIEVDGTDDGWMAVVEIVERPAVPDSQDILGRYEIDLADGAVTGYRRIDRYRRGDTDADEPR